MDALHYSNYKLYFRTLGRHTRVLCLLVTKSRMRDIESIIQVANETRRMQDQQPEMYKPSSAASQPVSYSQSWTFRYEIRASSPRSVLVVYKDYASFLPCYNRIRYRRKRFLLDEEWIVPNLLSRGACVCAGCEELVAFRDRDYDVDAWVRHRDGCSGIEKCMMTAVAKDLSVPRCDGERGPGEVKGTSLRAVRDFEDDEELDSFGGGSSDEGADDEDDDEDDEGDSSDEEDWDEDEDEELGGDNEDEDEDCRDGCSQFSRCEGAFVIAVRTRSFLPKNGTHTCLRKPDTGLSIAF
ncbi:hypothetical protein ARMGADRAFT_280749 [Armillaria gallica]|uniref:Uncharacterized protein n=1 Tax=Armillaria gallica TaxID=47427 RepID=A0A2H3EWN8_ARMGA|nr:hypothetical protein ARMGADRAFT_280749 [Armillaria gallica]